MRRVFDRLLRHVVRRRRVVLALDFPEATFHFEVQPDGILKPVLDDPRILSPYITDPKE